MSSSGDIHEGGGTSISETVLCNRCALVFANFHQRHDSTTLKKDVVVVKGFSRQDVFNSVMRGCRLCRYFYHSLDITFRPQHDSRFELAIGEMRTTEQCRILLSLSSDGDEDEEDPYKECTTMMAVDSKGEGSLTP
jgi:hypothetical protein